MQTPGFPFSAVVGQTHFKLALMLAAVNPAIGGVLISGPRGSAKSTLARGLADIIPNATPDAFVTLPLGATEEMLLGTLDLQQILDEKQLAFQPGLLAKADAGVLYVDEVNLLQDNLVDLLLDVSASGVNVVERDGVSHSHSAKFILLGTMNPDEGELRGQLQDRFGLSVELDNQYSIEERIDIVRQREAYDASPVSFLQDYQQEQQQLNERIASARCLLVQVQCKQVLRQLIAERCHAAGVDGLRADIVWYRAALAHAALNGRRNVEQSDVLAVEELVLAHRRNPITDQNQPPRPPPFSRPLAREHSSPPHTSEGDLGSMEPVPQKAKATALLPAIMTSSVNARRNPRLHSELSVSSNRKGSAIGRAGQDRSNSHTINWFLSLINNIEQWPPQRLRFRNKKTGQQVLHLLLLDTSASTLKNKLFAKAKAAVLDIARNAYLAREQLAIMGFGNQTVRMLMPKKRAPKLLRRFIDDITAAGGTPLREMLQQALLYQQRLCRQTPDLVMRTYLITDGRTTQPFHDLQLLDDVVVVDIEQSVVKRGKARQIAESLHAEYFSLQGIEC